MRMLPLLAMALFAVSCAAPEGHRWTFSVPIGVDLGQNAELVGVRFIDEVPIEPGSTIYIAGTVLAPEADGSDPDTKDDITGELYEISMGLREYYFEDSPIQFFLFGEGGYGNNPIEQLDNVEDVWNAMVGAGVVLNWNRDWSIEAGYGYRWTVANVNRPSFPGLDVEDALSGGIAWVGIGYNF